MSRAHTGAARYEARAAGYDSGLRGRMHGAITERVAERVLVAAVEAGVVSRAVYAAEPLHVLDVGCGTGALLRRLSEIMPVASMLTGVDAAPAMIATARAATGDAAQLRFVEASAEQLPFEDGGFDIVTTVTSFDHWGDQAAGLAECARVLRPGGIFVLADRIGPATAATARRRTRHHVDELLRDAGFEVLRWRPVYAGVIRSAVAVRASESASSGGIGTR